MYKYAVYKPSGGDARIKSGREEIYATRGDEALYAVVDTYLVDITWVSKMSWKNDTDAAQKYSYSYTTGLKVTQGSEVNNGFSLGASFKGVGITVDHSEKVFKSSETTESRTVTMEVNVPPRSRTIFYQKRYKFRKSMFFILDAWGREWNVGSWGSYEIRRKECEVEIDSEDFATLQAELDGSKAGTIDVETVGGTHGVDVTRKREDCTSRCKNKLDEMGA